MNIVSVPYPENTPKELSPRQIEGIRYTTLNPEKDIPKKTEWQKTGKAWSVKLSGQRESPPEIDIENKVWRAVVVYFDLDELRLTPTSDPQEYLDLIQLAPKDWAWKQIKSPSPAYINPENKSALMKLAYPDTVDKLLVIGDVNSAYPATTVETSNFTNAAIWILLVGRYISEHGEPKSQEVGDSMMQQITERREEVMALRSVVEMKKVIEKPFS